MPQSAATLREILRLRNVALSRDCETLGLLLSQAKIPVLLEPYRQAMVIICNGSLKEAQNNLALLHRYGDSLLEDVLSKTRVATTALRVLSSQLATPVLRGGALLTVEVSAAAISPSPVVTLNVASTPRMVFAFGFWCAEHERRGSWMPPTVLKPSGKCWLMNWESR